MLDPLASTNAQHYYPIFRKAEVFLNYAEAANEAWGPKGKDPDGICKFTAYQVIKRFVRLPEELPIRSTWMRWLPVKSLSEY